MLVNLSRRTFLLTGPALIVPTLAAGGQQGGPGVSSGPGTRMSSATPRQRIGPIFFDSGIIESTLSR